MAETAPTLSQQVLAAHARQQLITRRAGAALLLAVAWADVVLGVTLLTSWMTGSLDNIPALAKHFAYVPAPWWAALIIVAGLLQTCPQTRTAGLGIATTWHAAFAFGLIFSALDAPLQAPHYAVAVYLSESFVRGVLAVALIALHRAGGA